MRDKLTVYRTWAPDHAIWTPWAKPVLFAGDLRQIGTRLDVPTLNWIATANRQTMLIADLPGRAGVEEGLALAQLGYRPVPLYNGVYGPTNLGMIVNVTDLVAALFEGADLLAALSIHPEAPPVFLLDADRMRGTGKQPGKFDNRWCVFPQDMPSAAFLVKQGIKQIIVRSDQVQPDLSHILYRYQEQGIQVYLCDGRDSRPITVSKPLRFRSLLYRFEVILGLTRNAAGGFGGQIPDPVQNDSGGRYYGMG